MSEEVKEMTQEEMSEWVREQFQRANKHLAENGYLFDTVVTDDSRYMVPFLAVWKIKCQQKGYVWVISGDLPTDFTRLDNAKTARDAMRHFALTWQVKAQNIMATAAKDKTQQEFAALLAAKAEMVYELYETEAFWK